MMVFKRQQKHYNYKLQVPRLWVLFLQGSHWTGNLRKTWTNKVARESQEAFLFLQRVSELFVKMLIIVGLKNS